MKVKSDIKNKSIHQQQTKTIQKLHSIHEEGAPQKLSSITSTSTANNNKVNIPWSPSLRLHLFMQNKAEDGIQTTTTPITYLRRTNNSSIKSLSNCLESTITKDSQLLNNDSWEIFNCRRLNKHQSSPNVHNYFVRGIEIPTPPWVQEWFHWSTRLGIEAIKPPWWTLISTWQSHFFLWNNVGKDYQHRIESIDNCYFLQGFEVFQPP